MTNKRGNLNKDAGRGSPAKKTRKNLANAAPTPPLAGASSSVPKEAMEVAQGLRKTNHGVIFQLKLLMLFLIRGIRAGHAFRLGTEMEDIGGKFDDIIFQYEVDDGGKRQVNRYLQAKHKQDESTKITAGQLFNETEGDFSLLKYFSSYCGILSRGDDIQDCIICTNIAFNSDNLLKKGIQLLTVNTADEIFQFTGHPVARYKIQIDPGHAFWGKLRQINVAEPATKLKRNATDNEINSFFDKLVYVVNTPNEVTLGNLLTEEVGEYYELNEADFQSDFILRNMLDWFKLKKSEFLTSKQGQEILHQGEQKLTSLRMTSVSINYQTKLQEAIEFNAVAIDEMTEMLKTLLDSPNKIERIRTAFPKRTAVKVSAALKTLEKFKRDDSYLMSSSKGLKTTSFDDTFFDELVDETHCTKDELLGKLKVTVGNNIVWFVDDREKKELWNKIKKIFERRHQSNDSAWLVNRIPEKQLTPLEEWENRVVVVSDVAGTGKSTMLSNYYRKMRNEKPDNWIIKMDLVDHIGALRQFNSDEVDQQVEAIKFFIANIPNVRESPFAQSLLRHKLQTGDGIVVMLDGFDEIDIQCQEKCISLIKAIRLTNLNALYITTRPHVNGKLQDSLFQLAYTLRDFNQEDQINYLSGYWKKQLKVNADAEVRSIATSIVDRLSKSLKGNERSFIGIPLQCHIVADCFESQVYDIIQNGCDLEALLKDLDSNLNLDTLYERLFKKKREIYRQEKAKVQQVDNHILHNSLEDHMECLEIYLRDLAVKTIVSDQTHIDCLLGKSNESAATIEQQHKKREEGSVCFGLLTLNRKGEFQFLHRTYAEYLMANYLYGGFRLDDKLRNKLLDKKPVRQLISFQFLADEEYGGVQLFFDFMLIEILKGEKWRDTINRNENYEIPVHLKNFTNDCYDSSVQKPWRNCFSLAVRKEYMNIFTFLTCCMDVILEKNKVRKMVHAICKENREDFLLGFYYRRNCAGFLQFVDWYDDATAEKTDILYITKQFCNHLPHHTLQNTRLNQQEQKNIFRRLLDFMTKYEDTLKDVMEEVARARIYSVIQVPAMIANHPLAAMADQWQGMLKLFVRDDNFTFLLRPLWKLLSRTCDGQLLSDILRLAFETKDTMPQQSDMETVSNVLLDCCPSDGSTNQPLAPEVSRFILQMSPSVLLKVYSRYESAANMLDQQPGTDPYNLTQLHLKIFRGDEKAIESLLAMVNQNLTSSDPKEKEAAEKLIGCLTKRGEAPFTLIYLAAACNHEPILCNMLNCLKNGLSRDAFHAALNHSGKFLDNAYDDAMKYKKNEMYLSILKAVKKIIGNEYLLDLAKKSFIIQKKFDFTTVIEIQLLNHVANIFVEDDPQGYEYLNELIFFDNNITLIRYLDQSFIRGSISAIGIDKWINRLFDLIVGTFIWSIYDMLYNIVIVLNTNEEFSCFVKSITSTNDKRTSPSSIWAEIISRPNYGTNECLPKLKQIFDCISKQLGERAVEELILSDDRKVIAWVAFYGHTSMFNTMLASLSSVNQEAVKKQLEDNGPQMVLEILSTKLALSKYTYNYSNKIKTLKYCLENGTGEQLSQLVDTITVVHEIGGKTISRWSNLFSEIGENRLNCESEFQELTELFLNKLDTNDLRKLLLHNVGEGTFIVYVAFLGGEEFAWSILDRFSLMTREEFNNHLAADSHVIIQSVFFPNRALISKMLDYNMNPLNFFLAYACTDHLSKFIALITVTHREQNTLRKNIEWRIACLRDKTSADKIDDFLQRVYKKLGQRPRRRSSSNERIFLY